MRKGNSHKYAQMLLEESQHTLTPRITATILHHHLSLKMQHSSVKPFNNPVVLRTSKIL
jgi:hypothetical protein